MTSPLPPSAPAVGPDTRAVERRIATELARLASPTEVAGQQLAPPPYLRRHLAEHAAAGDVLNDHTLPRDFLPYLDLPRLRAAITSTAGGLTALRALRRATHQWDFNQPHSNEDALQMWAAALKTPIDTATHPHTQWHVIWANWPIGHSEILGKHTSAVIAVTALVLPDGRPIAITGSGDATVRVWDLISGTPIGAPLTGHPGPVDAVAALVLPDGRPIAVIDSDDDNTVRVWDLTTSTPIGDPLKGHTGTVLAAAELVLPDGRPIAITGGSDATVRVWDLTTGTPIGDPLTGHTGGVDAVAALLLARRPPGRRHRQRRTPRCGCGT